MPVHTNYASEIAERLDDYRSKGHKEASASRPPSDATRPDQNEAALQSEAEKWLASEQRLFDALITETSRGLTDTRQKTTALKTRIDQLLSDTSLKSAVDTDMAGDRSELTAATEKRMLVEQDWKFFRAENRITDQAVYPESRIWHFAIVGVLALIETGINAFFYENAQGLLGGFTVALGVAVINMGGALLAGMGFRYKNLASVDKRLLGWLCVGAFVVLSVYCNALFSAFRAEYQLLVDPSDPLQLRRAFAEASIEAKKIFLMDLRFADLMSLVLFGLGLLLSAVAFYKGYTFDDRYPGHGALDRRLRAAKDAETERQDLLRQKIKDFLHHRRADIQSVMNEPAQLVSQAATRIAELEHGKALLTTQTAAVQRDFSLVLTAYRNANAAVRATEPPAYFRETPDLSNRTNPAAADALIAELIKLQNEVKALRDRHHDALNNKLHEIQAEGAQVLNQALGQFFNDVVAEAGVRINRMAPAIHRAAA